ncbi:PAS domain S-box protein [Methylocystis parvus]|nr:PAS domain S-box protein [Methylocystis parvus]WBK01838.1 PAS domain S-box protein [Methylocystis parvus OBBP]
MDALPYEAALLDRSGRVIGANDLWMAANLECGDMGEIGSDLLDLLHKRQTLDSFSRQFLNGLEAVLCGARNAFSIVSPSEPRISVDVCGFSGGFDGALLLRRTVKAAASCEARQAFLVALGDKFRSLSDADAIREATCQMLGERLSADRVFFVDLDKSRNAVAISSDYFRPALESAAGSYPVWGFAALVRCIEQSRPLAVADVLEGSDGLESCANALQSRALAAAPLGVDDGEACALVVASSAPRAWTREEVELILQAAERATDAAKRALAEKALRESELRERLRSAELQALLDMAPIGLAIASGESGERIHGNRALEQMLGVGSESRLSKAGRESLGFRAFRNGGEMLTGDLPMQRAAAGEVVGGEVIDVLRDDGLAITVFAKAMPLYDEQGEPRGAIGAFMDITKIRKAEDALRESEQRWHSLVKSCAQAIWEADADGVVVADSPTWRAFTGQTPDEWLREGWVSAIHPDDRVSAERQWRDAIAAREIINEEFRLKQGDGWRWINVRATPIFGHDGKPSKWIGMIIDIDARKKAEAALRESEERQAFMLKLIDALRPLADPGEIQATACRLLAEQLDVSRVSYADIEGDDYVVRQSYARGVAPFMVRVPIVHLGASLLDQYRRGEAAAIADVRADNQFTPDELQRFSAGDIAALASVILSKRGRWVGALCAHNAAPRVWTLLEIALLQDVAERIWSAAERARAQAALRESEFRLQLALNSGNIGIYEWRIETGELIWDDRLRAQWGARSNSPISHQTFFDVIHPADRERVRSAVDRALKPGSGRIFLEEYRVSCSGGAERWVAATGAVFFEDKKPVRMVGTSQDITARKYTEAERQKFVALAEQSMEFVSFCSMDFEPLYLNPAGAKLVGLAREQAFFVRMSDYFFQEDHDFVFEEFFPKVQREGHANTELRFRHFKTGEALWMLYNVFVLRDERDEPIGFATVSRDISERKLVEDALKAADRRKDEFLATLAHELRNPLAPVRNAVHVLRHDAAATVTAKRDLALLAMIDRQVEHLVRLVDDLLEVSRITRGKIELKKRRVDLAEILRHAVETAQPTIDHAQHSLHVALPSEALELDADPVRLAQVFTNLLNNAAKYTEHGGDIWLMVERCEGEAVVTVRDSGVGIPAEMLPRVFDLFTQIDRTLGRAQGGLGIGLALVKSLLELHGGSVEAQSEGSGRGSAFVVRLPTLARDSTEESMPATAPTELRAVRRILVIDDDHDVADSLVMFLETFGAIVQVAYSGASGVEALADFKPDLVFLDLGMPGMDGYETARRIRALPEGRGVKLVALTGWGQEQVYDRARAAGFDRQLTKPAGFEALQQLLAQM